MDKTHKAHMSLEKVKHLHGLYLCGMSISKVATRAGISRQWLWLYFKQWNLPTRPKKKKQVFSYDGLNYTVSRDGYLRCTKGDRHHLAKRRWEEASGKTPPGFEVIFIDKNKLNCELPNLKLVRQGEMLSLLSIGEKELLRHCSNCKTKLIKRDNERVYVFNRRKTCSKECRYELTRGKPKGTKAQVL